MDLMRVNGTCFVTVADELDLQSAARILSARDIQGRVLLDCSRLTGTASAELAALAKLAERRPLVLSHVTAELKQSLNETNLGSALTVLDAGSPPSRPTANDLGGDEGRARRTISDVKTRALSPFRRSKLARV